MTTTHYEHETFTKTRTSNGNCGCHESTQTCCTIQCFERPNYFCGHLLTDADLSLQQKYLIEKQKLYHRTIDGHGVVCGLRLTCDHECPGAIRIGEGYAVDDCGNDLVVCETQRFDVVTELRSKGYLVAEPPPDPCQKPEEEEECPVRQCFYIAACYEEQPDEFTTPFRSGCGTGPTECEPTRIHERVRFEVLSELPEQSRYLRAIVDRIEHCWDVLAKGAIAAKLREHHELLRRILSGEANNRQEACDVFCQLRVFFLHHLRRYPDPYNCETEKIVRDLSCPPEGRERFSEEIKEVTARLLERMQGYVFDCIYGELAFACPAPAKASCVILGTVEVEQGTVRRVCNTPREYLWAPANFIPVLLYTLLTRRKRSHPIVVKDAIDRNVDDDRQKPDEGCCPDHPFDPVKFLDRYRIRSSYGIYKSTAAMRGIDKLFDALARAFDFTDPNVVSMAFLNDTDDVRASASHVGMKVEERPGEVYTADPIHQFMREMLVAPEKYPVLVYEHEGKKVAYPDYVNAATPDYKTTQIVVEKAAQQATQQVDAKIEATVERVGEMQAKFSRVEENISRVEITTNAKVATVEKTVEKAVENVAIKAREAAVETVRAEAEGLREQLVKAERELAEARKSLLAISDDVTRIKQHVNLPIDTRPTPEGGPAPRSRRKKGEPNE